MKLSLNFPDDYQRQNQNQILKAKVPITIIHHPFTATATTATAAVSGLSFSLATNFPSGPSFKLSYTPATTTNSPFSLSFKSGLGLFGSPQSSPLVFSTQFSLSSTSPPNPTFFLHFKPQLGHFSLHKSTSSNPNPNPNPKPDTILSSHSISVPHFGSGSVTDSDLANGFVPEGPLAWQDLKLEPSGIKEGFTNLDSNENCGIGLVSGRQLGWKNGKRGGFLNGVAVTARTALPVTRRVVVNLRWGVKLGADFGSKLPYLTVNKIGIERIQEEKEEKRNESNVGGDKGLLKGMCLWMRRDLELLENENREMKQCLREIREWASARKFHGESDSVKNRVAQPLSESSSGFERWRSKKNGDENGTKELKKPVNLVSDVENELQRAIKAASLQ